MALTASEFVALKAKVKAEMARRNQYGSLANYAGTAYDFPISPATGGAILANQGDKVIDLMLAVTDISGLASVHKGDLLPHLVDSTPIDGTNLLSKDAASITNWTVRIPSATTVTKGVGDYDATLSYTTIGGWEIVVSPPIAVEPNTAYTASLEYSVDTAFTSSGGDLYFGLQVCSHAPNGSASSSSGTVYAHLNFPNAVTALSRRSVTFTPTGPIIYLVFNGGNINDGQTVTFQINKLKLEKGTTHTGWSEPPASENQSINLNTIVDMWASQPMSSNVSLPSCRGACTGLCTSGCSGTCTGCGGCSGSCQGCSACGNACDGGCYGCGGGCSSCTGCTGCAGSSCKGCSGCGSSGCKKGCGSGCTSGCKSGCGGCGGGCAGGCGGGCSSGCGNSCSTGCYTGCTGCNGCNGCSGGCQNSCQSTCSTTCSNTCSNQCYGYCTGSSTNVIYGARLSTE